MPGDCRRQCVAPDRDVGLTHQIQTALLYTKQTSGRRPRAGRFPTRPGRSRSLSSAQFVPVSQLHSWAPSDQSL
jgi:hypothetical protein